MVFLKVHSIPYREKTRLDVVLLFQIRTVIDESKATAATTTIFGVEAENRDRFLLAPQHGGQLVFDLSLRDICHLSMDQFDRLYTHRDNMVRKTCGSARDMLKIGVQTP